MNAELAWFLSVFVLCAGYFYWLGRIHERERTLRFIDEIKAQRGRRL